MKHSFIFFASFLFSLRLVAQFDDPQLTVYQKLAGVNKEWLKKQYDDALLKYHTTFRSDEDLIQLHLRLVEAKLRNADTKDLSSSQTANRAKCLDYLKEYWHTGRFPKNTHHQVRTPYFIDDNGTSCAVAYLMIESGHEDLAQKVKRESNYAYIRDMKYPELLAWANENGFTVDELAWIQPGYSTDPPYVWSEVNAGVAGTVQTIEVDETNNVLYVAADFGTAANNIQSFNGTAWSDMNGGVNGTVNDILIQNDTVYMGGTFTLAGINTVSNVTYWTGNQWHDIGGGLPGTVKALAVFNGQLYAAGEFFFPTILPQAVLAKWSGTAWSPVLASASAEINALEVFKNKELFIGGNFSSLGNVNSKNLVKYDELNGVTATGGYTTPVNALANFHDTLYIGANFHYNDTTYESSGFAFWDGNAVNEIVNNFSWYVADSFFINSLSIYGSRLFATGRFDYYPMYGYHGQNAMAITTPFTAEGIAYNINGTVNSAAVYNGKMVIGGEFTSLSGNSVNRLAASGSLFTGIKQISKAQIKIFNNPAENEAGVEVEPATSYNDLRLELFDLRGKSLRTISSAADNKFIIPRRELPGGAYLFVLRSGKDRLGSGKIVFQ